MKKVVYVCDTCNREVGEQEVYYIRVQLVRPGGQNADRTIKTGQHICNECASNAYPKD